MLANSYLILGGARSGKSRLAEKLASQTNLPVTYIATAQAGDDEMAERIAIHQAQRPKNWQVIECNLILSEVIEQYAAEDRCLLIDCLTLWLTNCLCQQGLDYWLAEKEKFLAALAKAPGHIILVSNEVGHGIVPLGKLSREFVDQSGWLHQAVAETVNQVDFVMAGLPLTMKKNDSAVLSKNAIGEEPQEIKKQWWGQIIDDIK